MEGFKPTENNQEQEGKMSPKEVLNYAASMGEDIANNAKNALAMLEEAEEKGIKVDISSNELLRKFEVFGDHEKTLIQIRSDIGWVGSELFKQGVLMKPEDLNARFKKMEEAKSSGKERPKIKEVVNNISSILDHLKDNDYEGENLEKLKSDFFLILTQVTQIRDSKIPEELTESINRMHSIEHIPSDKKYISNELYKVRDCLEFLSGEVINKRK